MPPEHNEDWYADWFNEHYLQVYAHRNEDLAESEVEFIRKTLQISTEDRVLDLCCGAGRHMAFFQRQGFSRIVGIDLSETLLEVASVTLKTPGSLARSDMRRLPFDACFDFVLSLFTSFGYFADDRENREVLRQIRGALKPSGRVLMDLPSAGIVGRLVPESRKTVEDIEVHEKRWYDEETGRIEKTLTLEGPEGTKRYRESVRVYSYAELLRMFAEADLALESVHGDYSGGDFHPGSERMILVGRRNTVPAHLLR